VVEAAMNAIRPASLVPDRRLVAMREGAGERVVIQAAASERAEAELVVHTLERLLGGTSAFSFDSGRVGASDIEDGLSFDDVAILYRMDAQAPPLIEALGRAGIPFQKRSHRPLVEQAGVRVLLPILQEQAEGSVEARLERAIQDVSRDLAAADRTALLAAAELLRPLALRSGNDLDAFLAETALGEEVDTWDPRAERVSLLTLHAAKGLEFPVIFLVGCEDGLLPLTWPGVEADLAEERRLFFVGITRAQSRLFLFHSRKRTLRRDPRNPAVAVPGGPRGRAPGAQARAGPATPAAGADAVTVGAASIRPRALRRKPVFLLGVFLLARGGGVAGGQVRAEDEAEIRHH